MAFTLNQEKIKRYKDIFLLILKHVRGPLFQNNGNGAEELRINPEEEKKEAEKLTKELEEMGPTFIKLGQLLSTRPDLLSPVYIKSLTKLQDKIEPFSFAEAEEIITAELEVKLSHAFLEFDEKPIAAASLAQVHRAVLRNGKEVAVKVQRPGIRDIIQNDLETLEELAGVLDKHTEIGKRYAFEDILSQFRKTLFLELDYTKEAQSMLKLNEILQNYERLIVPRPVNDYSTSKILTMDFIHGTGINNLSPLAHLEMDSEGLATDLMKAYLDQVLIYGFFHADPHPGNIFITPDKKLALIDLGMTSRIKESLRDNLIKLLLSISEGKMEDAAKSGLEMGTQLDYFDEETYKRDASSFLSSYYDTAIGEIEVGKAVIELSRIGAKNGLRISPELTMLGKTLLNLDGIARILHPGFNPTKVIKAHSQNILEKHMLKNFSPGNIFSSILEMNDLLKKFPQRINKFFYLLSNNKLRIKIDAIDELRLTRDLQKIANRITLGAILASLIIGAALLMSVKTEFTIFGYPGFAMILFIFAVGCGITLAVNIFLYDEWKERKKTST